MIVWWDLVEKYETELNNWQKTQQKKLKSKEPIQVKEPEEVTPKYSWYDPEVNTQGGGNSTSQGFDTFGFPVSRMFTAGVRLGF